MQRTLTCLAILLLAACASRAERNMAGCCGLELDMTREEVVSALGSPDRTEAYLIDGEPVLYLFYLTSDRSPGELRRGQPPRPTDYTPLLFKEDRLKGWGACLFNNLRQLRPEPMGRAGTRTEEAGGRGAAF